MVSQDDVLRWMGDDGKWVPVDEMIAKAAEENPRLRMPAETVRTTVSILASRWGTTFGIEQKFEKVTGENGRRRRAYYRRRPE